MNGAVRDAAGRVWSARLRVVESLAAATGAWLVAVHALHHRQPFFAAAAALIVLGVTRGQRPRCWSTSCRCTATR